MSALRLRGQRSATKEREILNTDERAQVKASKAPEYKEPTVYCLPAGKKRETYFAQSTAMGTGTDSAKQ
jgi:hypothetical protein